MAGELIVLERVIIEIEEKRWWWFQVKDEATGLKGVESTQKK